MRRFIYTALIASAAFIGAQSVWAQSPSNAGSGERTKPRVPSLDFLATTLTITYQSSLAPYRSYQDQEVSSWQEANKEVGRIGGWQAYAREAQEASGATQPAPDGEPVAADPHADRTTK